MIVRLASGKSWTHKAKQPALIAFASASASEGDPTLTVAVNGEDVDEVTLRVPHSWWLNGGQPFCPPLEKGDVLELRLSGEGKAAVRLDI